MLKAFESRSPLFWSITSIMLVIILGLVDYRTGNDYSFSLFYLVPIVLSAWYVNRSMGIFTSILSAAIWMTADISIGEEYPHPIIYFWNALIRFGFFIVVSYLTSELHKTQNIIQSLARTDYVTGAVNSRYFHELLALELNRSVRYKRPFMLVYFDLDNFKQVNTKFGHEEGDRLLNFIIVELKRQLRKTDVVGRLGGDEFAILFPEVGQQEACNVISKVHDHLTRQLSEKYSFVTLSAGAVTYLAAPNSVEETIKIADDLMYSVKNSTKNGVKYSLYNGAQFQNKNL